MSANKPFFLVFVWQKSSLGLSLPAIAGIWFLYREIGEKPPLSDVLAPRPRQSSAAAAVGNGCGNVFADASELKWNLEYLMLLSPPAASLCGGCPRSWQSPWERGCTSSEKIQTHHPAKPPVSGDDTSTPPPVNWVHSFREPSADDKEPTSSECIPFAYNDMATQIEYSSCWLFHCVTQAWGVQRSRSGGSVLWQRPWTRGGRQSGERRCQWPRRQRDPFFFRQQPRRGGHRYCVIIDDMNKHSGNCFCFFLHQGGQKGLVIGRQSSIGALPWHSASVQQNLENNQNCFKLTSSINFVIIVLLPATGGSDEGQDWELTKVDVCYDFK